MRVHVLLLATLLYAFTCLLPVVGTAQTIVPDKISPELHAGGEPQDVLILFGPAPEVHTTGLTKMEKGKKVHAHLLVHAERQQKEVVAYLQEKDIPYQAFVVVNALYTRLQWPQVERIAQMETVRRVIPNAMMRASEPRPSREIHRSAGPEWGIRMIRADSVWSLGIKGQGVVVAGSDTGFDWMHPALISRYRGWDGEQAVHAYNWHDAIHEISLLHEDSVVVPENNPCGLNVPYPCDDHGHGTHTMGTMIGLDGDNQIGVAPGATWIACRNMERGYGSPATYLECFEWYLAPTDMAGNNPDPARAPHVINNSWSCPEMEGCNPDNFDILREAVENLRSAGIVVVVSAGNTGSACSSITTPSAIFEASFTVGATNSSDTIAGFSARGPVAVDSSGRTKPDVVAPGVQVRSAWLDSTYRRASGTSMSGPHVAGTIALMISANPALAGEVETIEQIVRSTAQPLVTSQECGDFGGEHIPNNTYGYGRIDALAAVEQAMLFSHSEEVDTDKILTMYPNPGTGLFYIDLAESVSDMIVRVYTVSGQLVGQQKADAFPVLVDLSDQPGGVYVVSLHTDKALYSGKLLKL